MNKLFAGLLLLSFNSTFSMIQPSCKAHNFEVYRFKSGRERSACTCNNLECSLRRTEGYEEVMALCTLSSQQKAGILGKAFGQAYIKTIPVQIGAGLLAKTLNTPKLFVVVTCVAPLVALLSAGLADSKEAKSLLAKEISSLKKDSGKQDQEIIKTAEALLMRRIPTIALCFPSQALFCERVLAKGVDEARYVQVLFDEEVELYKESIIKE
jgi:hypothetical protein